MRRNTLVYTGVLLLFAILIAHPGSALVNPNAMNGGCVIGTENGGLQDADCDRVPDQFDNCPLTPNPEQIDVDKNGIGDSCDLVIEEINVEPEPPIQGRSALVTVALFNNRAYPMRNLVLKSEMPALGLAQSEDVGIIGPGERIRKELVMRIPECAATKLTDLAVIADYPIAPGQKEVFSQTIRLPIAPSGSCDSAVQSDKTIVNIMDIQDVDPLKGAVYPFTIKNTWPESKAYVLSVDMQDDWGGSEIHPGTVIIVPAGEQRDGAVQVWARPGVTGKRNFLLTIQAKDDLKQVMLMANIPQSSQAPPQNNGPSLVIVAALIVIIALVAIFFMMTKKRK